MIRVKKIKYPNYLNDILKIRNKKYVRINSINKKKIKLKDHQHWYKIFCKIKNNSIFGIFHQTILIGYIIIDRKKNNNTSWYLKKKYWGKVNFYKILKKTTNNGNFTAMIKGKNISSIILALKSGFHIFKIKKNIFFLKK